MDKLERDGMVAVLYSPGFGAGWSTWESKYSEEMAMDREIVQKVLDGDIEGAIEVAERKYDDPYTGGASDLTVAWIPKGTPFYINEYDGSESILTLDSDGWMTT